MAQTDYLTGHACAFLGLIAAEHSGLAAGSDDQNCVAGLNQLGCLGGSTGYVECGEGELLGQVSGNLGVDTALEKDGLAVDVHLVHISADLLDLINAQGSQGQGYEGGDLVTGLEVDLVLEGISDLLYCTEEHSA